jgi:predicted nucleotidyltransferase
MGGSMSALDNGSLPAHYQALVDRFVQACAADDRVVAAFLGGSNAKGKADEYSDLDLCVITSEAAFAEFYDQREAFLRSLGDLVFLEDFGVPNLAVYIFADGTEGELNFGSEGHLDQIHSGPFRSLVDKKNILAGAEFPERAPDLAAQTEKLRDAIFVFWHEMSHFITAMGRGHMWWARGQLEALRSICVNLARLENNFSDEGVGNEPYFKIEYAMPVEKLVALQSTFCPLNKSAMLQSVEVIITFYSQMAKSLAERHGIPYPHKLEHVMLWRLEKLSGEITA